MRPKEIRWLLMFALAALMFVSLWRNQPVTIGISEIWRNGEVRVEGGTDPIFLGFSALFAVLFALLLYSAQEEGAPLPGVFRRWIAAWIDVAISMLTIAPLLGVVPMLLEWNRTGTFAWNFARDTYEHGDALQIGIVMPSAIVLMFLYFAVPLRMKRPTPGACIMNYQVLPGSDEGITWRNAVLRTLLAFTSMCAPYLAPFVGRDKKKGQIWVDKVFHTRAVKL